jgi:cell division protein FtsZ
LISQELTMICDASVEPATRVANETTTFADAFAMADQVLDSGVACITDLIVKEHQYRLRRCPHRHARNGQRDDGTGEASGERRALRSAEAAIANRSSTTFRCAARVEY